MKVRRVTNVCLRCVCVCVKNGEEWEGSVNLISTMLSHAAVILHFSHFSEARKEGGDTNPTVLNKGARNLSRLLIGAKKT